MSDLARWIADNVPPDTEVDEYRCEELSQAIVAEGSLLEDYFQRDEDGWIREKTNRHEVGGSFHFDASYIHGVRHVGDGATSIHVYSPALWRMGHYEHDGSGVMRRVSMTYADELLGAV